MPVGVFKVEPSSGDRFKDTCECVSLTGRCASVKERGKRIQAEIAPRKTEVCVFSHTKGGVNSACKRVSAADTRVGTVDKRVGAVDK